MIERRPPKPVLDPVCPAAAGTGPEVTDRAVHVGGRGSGVVRWSSAVLLATLLLVGAACGDANEADQAGPSATAVPLSAAAGLCGATPQSGGPIAAHDLIETSGLAASRAHPGVLWAHNDSGGSAELFAVGLDGSDLGRVELVGARAVDWEDIAILPGPAGRADVVVVADIGENPGSGSRSLEPVRLYRVDEPEVPGSGAVGSTGSVEPIDLTYADGPRDAEALLVDPLTGDGFVVSKQWDGSGAGVYLLEDVLAASGPVTMPRVATVADTGGTLVTGGDVAPDGRVVVLRTYTDVRVWDRDPGTTVAETLGREPTCAIPLFEGQGEAVAVLADGSGLVTAPEGEGAPVRVRARS